MILYQIAITLIPGIGDVNGKKLISFCGSAEAVFKEKRQNLMKIPGMGISTVNSILSQDVLKRAEKEAEFIKRNGIKPLYYLDSNYPTRLKHCMDGPIMLYYKGAADLNVKHVISVVGTRKASGYGRDVCEKIITGLSDLNILIVSGLAYGIDTYAHRIALEYKIPTVGILAHGLDRIYPYSNRALARNMIKSGGLLTDFMFETIPDRENFPKRNRIVAGISDATLVIESANRGGALITANIANSYSRDVFAVPGRIHDKYSEGCNYLIKSNKAALVSSAEDIKYFMQWEEKRNSSSQPKLFRELNDEENMVLEILRRDGISSIDYIILKSRLSTSKIAAILLNLEFDGIVKGLPGKMYEAM